MSSGAHTLNFLCRNCRKPRSHWNNKGEWGKLMRMVPTRPCNKRRAWASMAVQVGQLGLDPEKGLSRCQTFGVRTLHSNVAATGHAQGWRGQLALLKGHHFGLTANTLNSC
jgi:hypothetical protein